MKRFTFQLAPLLRLKQQLTDQTERKLAKIAGDKRRAEQHVEQLRNEIALVNRQLTATGAPWNGTTWHNSLRRVAAIEQQIVDGRRQVEVVANRWRQIREQYSKLSSETETLRLLRDERLRSHDREILAREQQELDEIVLRQWNAQHRS